jgi:hypothetical protein
MRVTILLLFLFTLPSVAFSQGTRSPLQVNFTASADQFRSATDEYRNIWAKEGPRIVAAMERATGLRFENGPIEVSVYEGTSWSGERGGRPMLLRASYPEPTKRGTLVHELAHRLAADVPFKGDHHELIFLFVYDVWVELWGKPFAEEQVAIEATRTNQFTDYAGNWKKALAMSATDRARRLQQVVAAKAQ